LSGLIALAPFTSLYSPAQQRENAPATTTTPLGTGDYARTSQIPNAAARGHSGVAKTAAPSRRLPAQDSHAGEREDASAF
jgi:hypothetical protein